MCTAKGSEVRPGVHLRGRRGTMCVAGGFAWQAWDTVLTLIHIHSFPTLTCGVFVFSSVSAPPSHPPPFLTHSPTHSLRLRCFCAAGVAGVGQCALPRGRMYALASLKSPSLLRGRHGTMCTAKGSEVCPVASLGSPPLLPGRRGTMCAAKGSDVRPGVPWVSAYFAWQAWDNVHCQWVGFTPWRPLGLRLFCVAGVAQCALPRGRMYALASLGKAAISVNVGLSGVSKVGYVARCSPPWRNMNISTLKKVACSTSQ